jgi:hypothetical protein
LHKLASTTIFSYINNANGIDEMSNNIELIEVSQNYSEEKTIVWALYNGETYGVSFESGPGQNSTLLDCDGIPAFIDNSNVELYNEMLDFAKKEAGINE